MIRLLKQPKGSRLCGQTCIAMLAGLPLDKVVNIVGPRGTTVQHLATALERLGFETSGRLKFANVDVDLPSICIAQVKYPQRRSWHWVLFVDGCAYDPSQTPRTDGRINAFLEVTKVKF